MQKKWGELSQKWLSQSRFVAEVKILENTQNRNLQRFVGNFNFLGTGQILRYRPKLFLYCLIIAYILEWQICLSDIHS